MTLQWNAVREASAYELVRSDLEAPIYSGPFTQAFVSGMPDGQYSFDVRALAPSGETLAESTRPARVRVDHWPLGLVAALFGVGLIAAVSVIVVIIRGAWTGRNSKMDGSAEVGR